MSNIKWKNVLWQEGATITADHMQQMYMLVQQAKEPKR